MQEISKKILMQEMIDFLIFDFTALAGYFNSVCEGSMNLGYRHMGIVSWIKLHSNTCDIEDKKIINLLLIFYLKINTRGRTKVIKFSS